MTDAGLVSLKDFKQLKLIDLTSTQTTDAGLANFKAVVYEKSPSLVEKLTGLNIKERTSLLDPPDLSANLTPRLWYLAPTADAGLLVLNP